MSTLRSVCYKMHYHCSPYMRQTQNGSRMVGGEADKLGKYNKFESTSYITPDTVKQEGLLMRMTKDLWTRRRRSCGSSTPSLASAFPC